jgi:hypothetical protein
MRPAMRPVLHRGAEDAITPALADTRRRYADAYRSALPEAARQFASWLATGRVLAMQRHATIRQIAHAAAASGLLKARLDRSGHRPDWRGDRIMSEQTSNALDGAGAALKEMGEEVVLLAFYQAGSSSADDRYSVRLALDGAPGGIQESAATPSAAFAKAFAARASRRATLNAEAAIRAEIAVRRTGARDRDEAPGAGA